MRFRVFTFLIVQMVNSGGGMLNGQYAWLPGKMPPYTWEYQGNGGPDSSWLQLDLATIQDVTGVVIQGYPGYNWFTRTVSFMVSIDQKSWADIACGQNFQANTDGSSKVHIIFPKTVKARFIRILPQT
jgi:hypothetical protein